MNLADLSAPFPPERISWRVGSTTADKKRGMALCFIDARDVMERLDAVCGITGWQCRYPHANGKTVCEIGIRCDYTDGFWVWKADGAGDTDFEAEKGALSDAFKRAAVRWGIGRYLYDMPAPWVAIEQAGKSYKIVESELPRLRAMLSAARGNGHVQSPPSETKAHSGPAGSKPQSVPRASSRPADRQGWRNWVNSKRLLPERELSDWQASEEYSDDMAALETAQPDLHKWLLDKLSKRNAA